MRDEVVVAAVKGEDGYTLTADGAGGLRVADAATGEPTGDELVTNGPVDDVHVLDRGQAVVFAGNEVALPSR